MKPLIVDYLVIGAGTSGCVVAGGLASSGDRSVLVLEAGGAGAALRTRVPVAAKWQGSTYNVEAGPISGLCHLWRYIRHRQGPFASPHAQLLAHVRSTPAAARPDVQIAFYPYAFERTPSGVKRARTPAVMFTVMASQGRGRGEIMLNSADPLAPPGIRHALLADDVDRQTLIAGCRLVHRIASSAPLASEIRSWIEIDPGKASDADWGRYLSAEAGLAYHAAGTCRMGDQGSAVVDAALRVRGIAGLRVADNSIMPTPVSGNSQAAAYVIGAKAAALILAEAA